MRLNRLAFELGVWIVLVAPAGAQARDSRAVERCRLGWRLSQTDCEKWADTTLKQTPSPADALDEKRAFWGRKLFFETKLSPAGVQCVSCHIPESGYSDKRKVSVGIRAVTRNSPSLLNATYFDEIFWDGRARALWEQPLFTLTHPDEMAADPLGLAHVVFETEKEEYESVFGPLPPLNDSRRFPAHGTPGQAAFDQMTAPDREAVMHVFRNIGRAFESYMRRLRAGPSRIDRFLDGQLAQLSPEEVRGARVVNRVGCLNCHGGVYYSDQKYHNLRVPGPRAGQDLGRAAALMESQSGFARALRGKNDEASPAQVIAQMTGAFRTPSLRNLMRSGPYFHNGSAARLSEVIEHHARLSRSRRAPPGLTPFRVTAKETADIEAFLRALEGSLPPLPWYGWPYH